MTNLVNDSQQQPILGVTPAFPDEEWTRTAQECFFQDPTMHVLSFDATAGIEVLGVTGTIYNKEGLFAQSGWFGGNDLDWFWIRIKNILRLEVRTDRRFRGGEPCVWLVTEQGEYAMLLPSEDFEHLWDDILTRISPNGVSAKFQMLTPVGPKPFWWDEWWEEAWPGKEATGSKRKFSTSPEERETAEGPPTASKSSAWQFHGPKGDRYNRGGMRNNTHFLAQWVLPQDGGMSATYYINGEPRNIDSEPRKRGRREGPRRRRRQVVLAKERQ
ncbi:hypothetical protein FRC09_014809 [Ceratobasidium sp. 395]|nr:hypothetical protein FRC09_014809 [Ceratobasidium sp. 395]